MLARRGLWGRCTHTPSSAEASWSQAFFQFFAYNLGPKHQLAPGPLTHPALARPDPQVTPRHAAAAPPPGVLAAQERRPVVLSPAAPLCSPEPSPGAPSLLALPGKPLMSLEPAQGRPSFSGVPRVAPAQSLGFPMPQHLLGVQSRCGRPETAQWIDHGHVLWSQRA